MSVSLLFENFLRGGSWLLLCYKYNLLQSIRLCPLQQDHLCANGLAQPCQFTMSLRVTWWMFTILLFLYFLLYAFLYQCSISSRCFPNCSRVQSTCCFLFLTWLPLPVLFPIIGPFNLRNQGSPYPVVAPGLVLCAGTPGFCIMLCEMA